MALIQLRGLAFRRGVEKGRQAVHRSARGGELGAEPGEVESGGERDVAWAWSLYFYHEKVVRQWLRRPFLRPCGRSLYGLDGKAKRTNRKRR